MAHIRRPTPHPGPSLPSLNCSSATASRSFAFLATGYVRHTGNTDMAPFRSKYYTFKIGPTIVGGAAPNGEFGFVAAWLMHIYRITGIVSKLICTKVDMYQQVNFWLRPTVYGLHSTGYRYLYKSKGTKCITKIISQLY